jgi:hypothetical protein
MFVLRGLLAKLAETKTIAFAVKAAYRAHAEGILGDVAEAVPVDGGNAPEPADLMAAVAEFYAAWEPRGYALLPLGGNFKETTAAWHQLHECWAHRLYLQCGLDPGLRFSGFGAPPGVAAAAERSRALAARVRELAAGRPYALVHDDAARPLDRARLPLPWNVKVLHVDDPRLRSEDLFDYVDALAGAAEFHGIDSCFMHLAQHLALPRGGGLRACHAYARGGDVTAVFPGTKVVL